MSRVESSLDPDTVSFVARSEVVKRILSIIYRFQAVAGEHPYTRQLLFLSKTWRGGDGKQGHELLKKLEALGVIRRYPDKKCFKSRKDGKEYCIEVIRNALTPKGIALVRFFGLDRLDGGE